MTKFEETINELKARLSQSFKSGFSPEEIALLWRGYFSGLSEYSLLDLYGWYELDKELPVVGVTETTEMVGGPITDEEWEQMRLEDEEYARTGISIAPPPPTIEEDLNHRINVHLGMHNGSHTVVCLWKGFLSAAMEWKIIDREAFNRLISLLPPGDEDHVMREIFHLD